MGALNRKNFIPVVLVALVIVIGLPVMIWLGFSRDSTGTTVQPNATNAVSTVAGVQAPGSDATIVQLVDFAFQPEDITVQKGQKISFQNTSPSQHEVVIDGGRVDSSPMQPGSMFTWTADKTGKFTLSCKIHPNQMGGTITVQ